MCNGFITVSFDIATHNIGGILSLSVHVFRMVRAVGLPRLVRLLSWGEGLITRLRLMAIPSLLLLLTDSESSDASLFLPPPLHFLA